MSLLRKFKVMHMRINGFYGGKARWWLSAKQYDQKYNTKYTSAQKKWAYKHGFLPAREFDTWNQKSNMFTPVTH